MLMLDQWEQSAIYDPADPTQKKIETYVGLPGGYATFYFNRVPVSGGLRGLAGSSPVTWRSLVLTGALVYGGLWAAKRTGVDKKAKAVLRKIPVVNKLPGLSGLGRRRRR